MPIQASPKKVLEFFTSHLGILNQKKVPVANPKKPVSNGIKSEKNYKIEKVLQEGKKSQVLLVKNVRGERCILKKIDETLTNPTFIEAEIEAGKKIKHAGTAKFIDSWSEGRFRFLLLEYVDGFDLFQFLEARNFEPLPESQVKKIFSQLVKIITHLHRKGFLHRDLKLENIILQPNHKIKLIDFGLSTQGACNKTYNVFLGSPEYVCPLILQKKPYTACKAEIWSLGIILYALLFGQFPFSTKDREQEFVHCPEVLFSEEDDVSEEAKDLILQMLDYNETKRPTVESLIKHPWLKNS